MVKTNNIPEKTERDPDASEPAAAGDTQTAQSSD
jgi:hypothetical protein